MPKANAKAAPAAPAAPATAAPAPAPAAPARGAVTQARWGACLKGGVPLMPASVRAMPLGTVITNNCAQNPTRNRISPWPCYGFNNVVGATTTLGAFYAAIAKASMGGPTQAAAHVAWHVNHGFVTLTAPATAQPGALAHLA